MIGNMGQKAPHFRTFRLGNEESYGNSDKTMSNLWVTGEN
jgi:hypothetical protein